MIYRHEQKGSSINPPKSKIRTTVANLDVLNDSGWKDNISSQFNQKKTLSGLTKRVPTVGQLGSDGCVRETIERLMEIGVFRELAGIIGVRLLDWGGRRSPPR